MMHNTNHDRVSVPRSTITAVASHLYDAAPRTMRGERAWNGTADELGWAGDGVGEDCEPDPVLAPRWAVENAVRLLRERGRWFSPPKPEALALADVLEVALGPRTQDGA